MRSELKHLPARFSHAAEEDLECEIDYLIGEAGERIALRYAAALEKTLQLLSEFPLIGTRCQFDDPQLSSLRRKPVYGRFASHLVFYIIAEDHIHIVRILHGRQNWLTLLQKTEPQ